MRLPDLPATHDTSVSSLATFPQVPVSDRTKILPRLFEDISHSQLQQFIYDWSSIRGLRLCGMRFDCKRVLCPWCSTRRATAARRDLAPTAHTSRSAVVLRFSVAASSTFEEAWDLIDAARALFVDDDYLKNHVDAWWIQKEVTLTRSGRWNLHIVFLLFDPSPEAMDSLYAGAADRWTRCAASVGARAHRTGQKVQQWSNARKAVAYTVKGLLHQKKDHEREPGDGYSPGDLLALYVTGDADAADAWNELERFANPSPRSVMRKGVPTMIKPRRRWSERGGTLREDHRKKADYGLCA